MTAPPPMRSAAGRQVVMAELARRMQTDPDAPGPWADPPPVDDPPEPALLAVSDPDDRLDAGEQHDRHLARELAHQRVRAQARAVLAAEVSASALAGLPAPVTLDRALAAPEEAQRWRIDGLLPAGGNATLSAVRKTGKTTVVANLVAALADGHPFLGAMPVEPLTGRVAVLNYEVGHAQLTRWLRDLHLEHPERVVLFPLRGHRLPLLADDGAAWLVEQLRAAQVEVLVVDPFGRAFVSAGGETENDNTAVLRFLSRLDEVKTAAGVAELVMPVHGSRDALEGRERSRGASALEDWPDALWRLVPGADGARFLSATGRDVDVPEQRLDYDPATRRLTLAGGSRRVEALRPVQDELVELLEQTPRLSGRAVEAALEHLERDPVRAALADLVRTGRVVVEDGPRRARLHSLASTGSTLEDPVRGSARECAENTRGECASVPIGTRAHHSPDEAVRDDPPPAHSLEPGPGPTDVWRASGERLDP